MAVLAPSLVDLRSEVDARYPNRSRKVDGWYRAPNIGGPSEHHPDGKGMVHAIDITAAGINPMSIVDAAGKLKVVAWYAIWNRTIWSHRHGWTNEPYHGPNPHTDHVHVSIFLTSLAENYRSGWGIARGGEEGGNVPPVPPEEGVGTAWDYGNSVQSIVDGFLDAGQYVDAITSAMIHLRT